MKRKNLDKILMVSVLVMIIGFILVNSFFVYNDLVQSSKSIMFSSMNNLGKSTEVEFSRFVSDAEFYVSSHTFDEFYKNEYFSVEQQSEVRMLLANYEEILKRVVIAGENRQMELSLGGMNHLKKAYIDEKLPKGDIHHMHLYDDGDRAYFSVPAKSQAKENYMVYYELDLVHFLTEVSRNYYFGHRMWTWYVEKDNDVVCLSYSEGASNSQELVLSDLDLIFMTPLLPLAMKWMC